LNRPHLQQHPLRKAEMGFYAITLGFVLSSVTKVNTTIRSVNKNYLTKFAKVSRCVSLHNRKINVTIRGTDIFLHSIGGMGSVRPIHRTDSCASYARHFKQKAHLLNFKNVKN
jgi:hypothetical protein